MASPFVRHLLLVAAVAVATYLFAGVVPIAEQPTAWLAAGGALGAIAALLGRRWLGIIFLAAGSAIGVLVHLHVRLGSGEEAVHELLEHGAEYGLAFVAALAGYAVVVAIVQLIRLRGRDSRSARSG